MYKFLIIVLLISLCSISCVPAGQGNRAKKENPRTQSDNGQQIIYNGQLLSTPYFAGTAPNVVPYGYGGARMTPINYAQPRFLPVPTNAVSNGQPQFLYPGGRQEIYAPQYEYNPSSGCFPANNGQSLLLSALQQPMPNMRYPAYIPTGVIPNQPQSMPNIRYSTQYEYIPTDQSQVPIYNNQVPNYNNQVPIYNNQDPYNPYRRLQSQQPLMRSIDAIPMVQTNNPWPQRNSQTEILSNNFMEPNNNSTSQGDKENGAMVTASASTKGVDFSNFPIYEPLDFSGFRQNISFTDNRKDISFDSDVLNICARCEEDAKKCEITDIPKDKDILVRTRVCKILERIISSTSKEIPNPNHTKEITMHTVELA